MNILYKLIDRLAAIMTPVQRHDNHYGRPTGAALRNPADPIQAARIEAAAVKRARKAEKLYRDARYSGSQNYSLSHIQIK